MAIFFVELSAPPAALLDVQADLMRVRAITGAAAGSRAPVRVLHVAYVPAREACMSLIDGADQDSVRAVLAQAGVRAEVLPAVALG